MARGTKQCPECNKRLGSAVKQCSSCQYNFRNARLNFLCPRASRPILPATAAETNPTGMPQTLARSDAVKPQAFGMSLPPLPSVYRPVAISQSQRPLSEKGAYPEQHNQSMRYQPDANARNPVHWKYYAGDLSNMHSTKVERRRESTRHTGHPAVHHLTTAGPQGEQHSRYLQRSALPRDQYHSNPDLSRQYKQRVADDHQQYSRYRDGDRGPLTPKRKASDPEELRHAKQPRSNSSSPHAEHYSYYSRTRALSTRPQFSSQPDVRYRSTYGHGVEGSRDSTSAAQYRPMESSRDSTSAAQHRPSEHISPHKAWSSSPKRYSLDFQGLHQQPVAYQLARAEGGDLIDSREADVGLRRYKSIESTVEITHDVVSPDWDADHEFNPSGRIPRDDVYTGSARSNRVVHEEPSSNLADMHVGPLYSHPRQQSVHARPISVHKIDDQNRITPAVRMDRIGPNPHTMRPGRIRGDEPPNPTTGYAGQEHAQEEFRRSHAVHPSVHGTQKMKIIPTIMFTRDGDPPRPMHAPVIDPPTSHEAYTPHYQQHENQRHLPNPHPAIHDEYK